MPQSRSPESSDADPLPVVVHLNARVQPAHRGEIYEEPLQAAFDRYVPGCEVVGGGSELDPTDGARSCDIEVELRGDRDRALTVLVTALEHFGAPVGSSYAVDEDAPVPFGRTHGVALSLDGTSLPTDVYATNDVNELIDGLAAELGDSATLQSWWEGPERTSLYFYGEDPARIRAVLEAAPERWPLAERSRVEDLT
ncbi:hypothetical protein [Nocardioides xinjiangensis]|uniref:hypothetical protein n=1 Tax=Nocardioides xinjiangensis TaxID=2817376 RepID=UPI001B30976A|nr:hypothetical protein [Nocardioides sp. SYSU D00514]